MIKYSIELNINNINTKLLYNLKEIAKNNGFETVERRLDVLTIESDSGINFTKVINEMGNVCKVYGVDYVSLLEVH